jgi:AraC family transcriptional activator of pobA
MEYESRLSYYDPKHLAVPKVRLYVEKPERRGRWFVNVGHVTERGRWRTEPHTHPSYGQVIFIRDGCGVMNVDGCNVPFEAPCALLIPNNSVHSLDYAVDADRWVVTIDVAYLGQINAKLPEFTHMWATPRVISLGGTPGVAGDLHLLITRLERELADQTSGHVIATEALLTSLMLTLMRSTEFESQETERANYNAVRVANLFRDLVEKHYREHLRLQDYASMMALSPAQLRAACVTATGFSPNKLIHARIIAEAKRSLIFSGMTIEQIAYWLDFSDPAYFTRFFRKEVGQSPNEFRMASRQEPLREAA